MAAEVKDLRRTIRDLTKGQKEGVPGGQPAARPTTYTMKEGKIALKATFNSGREGIKVSGVRKRRNGVVVALGDEESWQTVVRSEK